MSVYLRRPKLSDDMNEEEVQQEQQPTQDASTQQQSNDRDYTKEFAVVNAKLAELERRFNAEKQPLINQRTAIMQAAAKAGISLTTNEGVSYRFSTKLFESVMKNSKTEELINLIDSTFAALPDLSYYMDKKGCTSLAKRLLAYLNDQYWNDGQNHWNDVSDFIRGTLGKANISLSTKEMMTFVDKLGEMMKPNSMFTWIFGNQAPGKKPISTEGLGQDELLDPIENAQPAVDPDEQPIEKLYPDEEEGFVQPEEEELPEESVYYPGETEDDYDRRYFGGYPDDEELYDEDGFEDDLLNESRRPRRPRRERLSDRI